MLTNIPEDRRRKTPKYRSVSKQSQSRKYTHNEKENYRLAPSSRHYLPKDEMQYKRFVRDLRREINVYLETALREDRFDTSSSCRSKMNYLCHQRIRTGSVIGVMNNRSNVTKLKLDEEKRIDDDVQTILSAPTMKEFYTYFIKRGPMKSNIEVLAPSPSLEESIILSNEPY